MQHPQPEEIELRPPVHLAFQILQAIDMPFCDAIAKRKRASRIHSSIIAVKPIGEAGKFGYSRGFGTLEPMVEGLGLATFEERHKGRQLLFHSKAVFWRGILREKSDAKNVQSPGTL